MNKFPILEISKKNPDWFNIQTEYVNEPFPPHMHNFYEIVIVYGGSSKQHINDIAYDVSVGDVFILKKTDVHEISQPVDYVFSNIIFDQTLFLNFHHYFQNFSGFYQMFMLENSLSSDNSYRNHLRLNDEELEQVKKIIDQALNEKKCHNLGYDLIILSHLIQIVVYICRAFQRNYPDAHDKENRNFQLLTKSLKFMHENYVNEITVEQLASIAGFSQTHFLKLFRQTINSSPIDYIVSLRIQKAAEHLKDSSLTITEIATNCGFNDSNYFSRIFKRKLKQTPSEYRKLYQNSTEK